MPHVPDNTALPANLTYTMPYYKVGVMGSSARTLRKEEQERLRGLARKLGTAIAASGMVVVTGETSGIPYFVAQAVRDKGGLSVGISPAHSHAEQQERYPMPPASSDVVIYTGFGLKGRNVINIRSSDIVIIFAGSIGTLNEFTIAYDEGKVIGVLAGSGGISDSLASIIEQCNKPSSAKVVFHEDPVELLRLCCEAVSSQ